MKIGLDVDGVLTNLEEYQLKYGKKYFLKKNPNLVIDETGYDICDIFHCTKEEREKFWTKYIWKYCLSESVQGALNLVARLRAEGHEIHIITGRAHTTEKGTVGDLFRKMLIWRLKKDGIEYDSINFVSESGSAEEKVEVCKKLGIDVMIDDKKENIEALDEITECVCIDAKYNQNIKAKNYVRVNNLDEAYEAVERIVARKKDSNPEIKAEVPTLKFTRDKFKMTYGIVRLFGATLFKVLLKPIIINKGNIPKNGPILLCGNHLHVWDQFPVICATKRTTHWMSKKEYFDSKLGLFFKMTGAISVDRFGDPHESVDTSLNYLAIGSAVGLFPEGTRNHAKKEKLDEIYSIVSDEIDADDFYELINNQQALLSQLDILLNLYKNNSITKNDFLSALMDIDGYFKLLYSEDEYYNTLLLPFKFGAVSMAKKTGATIVPFAVTGDYKIGNNNLVVNIGEGFKVDNNMSLSDANEKLRKKILVLLKENKKR